MPDVIKAVIVFGGKTERCEVACGPDWSSAAIVEPVKRQFQKRFGDIASLELVDLSTGNNKRSELLRKRIKDNSLALPLLLVDGELRIAGEFDVRQLMDAVEVQKELKWKTNTM